MDGSYRFELSLAFAEGENEGGTNKAWNTNREILQASARTGEVNVDRITKSARDYWYNKIYPAALELPNSSDHLAAPGLLGGGRKWLEGHYSILDLTDDDVLVLAWFTSGKGERCGFVCKDYAMTSCISGRSRLSISAAALRIMKAGGSRSAVTRRIIGTKERSTMVCSGPSALATMDSKLVMATEKRWRAISMALPSAAATS